VFRRSLSHSSCPFFTRKDASHDFIVQVGCKWSEFNLRSGLEASVCIGTSSLGAGGSPGIPNHNQCDESLFRAIKRVIRTKATVEYFLNAPCRICSPIWPCTSLPTPSTEESRTSAFESRRAIHIGIPWSPHWRLCARRNTTFTVAFPRRETRSLCSNMSTPVAIRMWKALARTL
jgi:hypothetical protein